MNLKLYFHGVPRTSIVAGLLATLVSAVAAFGADQVSTPSTVPRDRHDMVTSQDTKLNEVGKQPNMAVPNISHGDRTFIEKAMRGGLLEIKIAQLALSNASDESIKKYAQQLIDDHTAANKELSDLAARKGVSLVDLDRDDRHVKSLSKKSGADFDQTYVDYAVHEHKEDIDMFEKASRKADDPDVAAFAAKNLAVLHQHEQMALDIQKTLKH
ncbi:MAG TPA: DUF4142 domain-containing protein [Opitutaceae bacterium]|nr:DUF4142 domain-containing protein [Opitutaceae bacterium]